MKLQILLLFFLPSFLKAQNSSTGMGPEEDLGPVVVATVITGTVAVGYATWKIFQSKKRAIKKSEEFFPDETGPGQKGDAFRHLYVTTLLRRSITQPGAWLVMGAVEVIQNNPPKDRQMDFHNNRVARKVKYREFLGESWESTAWKIWKWMESDKNSYQFEWGQRPPHTQKEGRQMLNEISLEKYVYY